ncbi:hypothetical protein BpHYR1_037258, partial [Brachionus plicatilis]
FFLIIKNSISKIPYHKNRITVLLNFPYINTYLNTFIKTYFVESIYSKTSLRRWPTRRSPMVAPCTLHIKIYCKEKKLKPNVSLITVYINKNDELIIKTDDQNEAKELKQWPPNAFEFGIYEVVKTKKFYLALHDVDVKFDIESERVKQRLKQEYDIDNTLRMVKKSTGQKLELVKIVTSNQEKFNQMINDKKIRLGSSIVRVSPWRFGVTPDQCFKCLEFGHEISVAANEDPTPILEIIGQNLGKDFSNAISNHLFKNLDQLDPNMINRFMDFNE